MHCDVELCTLAQSNITRTFVGGLSENLLKRAKLPMPISMFSDFSCPVSDDKN